MGNGRTNCHNRNRNNYSLLFIEKNKSPLTESQINSLSALSINRFDRNATKQWNPKIAKISDVAMLGGMAMPGLLYIDKDIRKDYKSILPMTLEMYF